MLVLVDLLVYNCIAPMIPVHVPVNTDRYCCTRVLVLYLVLFTATDTAVLHVVTNYSTAVAAPPVELPVATYTCR